MFGIQNHVTLSVEKGKSLLQNTLVSKTHRTFDGLVQSSISYRKLKWWVTNSQIIDVNSSPIDFIRYAVQKDNDIVREIMLLLLGSSETCTPTYVSEFARKYSLPTHEYKNNDNNFRRYSVWLEDRNKLIIGFTKYDGNYYMVADIDFYHCYSRYGFCAACGILRCGASVDINNYPTDGPATIRSLTSLLKDLNYKQTHQTMPIWNGFHLIVYVLIMIGGVVVEDI